MHICCSLSRDVPLVSSAPPWLDLHRWRVSSDPSQGKRLVRRTTLARLPRARAAASTAGAGPELSNATSTGMAPTAAMASLALALIALFARMLAASVLASAEPVRISCTAWSRSSASGGAPRWMMISFTRAMRHSTPRSCISLLVFPPSFCAMRRTKPHQSHARRRRVNLTHCFTIRSRTV